MLKGLHLIAGNWVSGDATFDSEPAHGPSHTFAAGTPELVDTAAREAEEAFWSYGYSSRATRAEFLRKIADEIDVRGDQITEIGTQETGLPEARLIGERGRTTGQLRYFADHIEKGDYLDSRHDEALPDRAPLPRPDMRLMQRPLGPIAVFGASNFPLAFSVAGGDTASALAAGCPVVVKGHSGHPGTSEIVAQAIDAAIKALDIHPGVFSLVQGGQRVVGTSLVEHPAIVAVGFTGSLGGGRALFDLCAARPTPIPFYGELGSVNPVFILSQALAARGEEIANNWVGSLIMGAGQFCTNPGVLIMPDNADTDAFIVTATVALKAAAKQTMLNNGIADAYCRGVERLRNTANVEEVLGTNSEAREALPNLYVTTGDVWLGDPSLGEEVFGPLGVIVRVRDKDQALEIARGLEGQLTCTLQIDEGDHAEAGALLSILERKAGRILANGFPTGVEVCDTMMHGGPYPASTNTSTTSVGSLAIRRFLRPVCFQNIPQGLLPDDIA